MFYICEQCNNKFGVRDTKDNTVEYYTTDELNKIRGDYGIFIFGSLKNGNYRVFSVEEYQKLEWGTLTIFSFYNKLNNHIYTVVEDKINDKILYTNRFESYITDDSYKSHSTNKNGDLICIFMDGKENKCVGYSIWLDYECDGDIEHICTETYLEYRPDGKLYVVCNIDWDFRERGAEYYYNEKTDSVDVRFIS